MKLYIVSEVQLQQLIEKIYANLEKQDRKKGRLELSSTKDSIRQTILKSITNQ